MVSTYPRALRAPTQSSFLLGVRGVGKSTWARRCYSGAICIDRLDERLYNDLLADPSTFADMLVDVGPRAWVVVDEVQRIPSLLNEVHRADGVETVAIRPPLLQRT